MLGNKLLVSQANIKIWNATDLYFTSNVTAALQSRITQYSYFDYNVKLGDFPLHNNNEINAATTDLSWQGFIIKHHFLAFHDSFKTIILRLSFFLIQSLD